MSQPPIDELKRLFGRIFQAKMEGETFIFRQLFLGEIDYIINPDVPFIEKEEFTVTSAVVWPENYDFDQLSPGSFSLLSQKIIEGSGLSSIEAAADTLERIRAEVYNSMTENMMALIVAAMPTYKYEDLEPLSFEQTCRLVSRAELIFKVNNNAITYGDVTLNIVDKRDEEPEATSSDPQSQHEAMAQKLQAAMQSMQ